MVSGWDAGARRDGWRCARQDLIRCHRASDGTSLPTSSSLNYNAGQTVANMTITPVGSDGYVDIHNGGRTPVSVMADLSGTYYSYG